MTYAKYGQVLMPPQHILDKQTNWKDENHFNQTGAEELSLWLIEALNKNLQ